MVRSVRRVLREQYIGVAALFVALGGTSYAAVSLPAGSVASKQLRTGAVTAKKLKSGAVTSTKLAKGSVTAAKLAPGAVSSATVLDGSLLAQDFKPGQLAAGGKGDPGPAGPAGAKGDAGAVGPSGPLDGPAGGDLDCTYPAPTLRLPLTRAVTTATSLLALTNTAPSGVAPVIEGTSDSTSSSAVAVRGRISSTSPGPDSVAVRGINQGTSSFGIGVMGSHAGSGWGVYGNSTDGSGVRGFSSTGTGVVALGGPTSTALEINGPLKVSGGSRAAGFVQTVSVGTNTCSSDDYTVIDNANANGAPSAMILVTPRGTVTNLNGTAVTYTGSPTTIPGCPASRWVIYKPGLAAWVTGNAMNVLVMGS